MRAAPQSTAPRMGSTAPRMSTVPSYVRRHPIAAPPTDAQWKILEPQARQVMDELRRTAGRPMVHDLRALLDAIGYVVRNGIEWQGVAIIDPPPGSG